MMNIVLDSNVFLHYKWFEEIPWKEELGCNDVTILVSSVVLEEIDKVKDEDKGKVQKRAKMVSSKLGGLLLDDVQGKYPVKYIECPYALDEDKQKYHLDRNDNQILFSVLKSGYAIGEVCVVSSDNAMLIRAKQYGFKVHRLSEKYRLQEELSNEEKEVRELKVELDRLKNRLPKPELLFGDGEKFIIIKRAISAEIDSIVEEEMANLRMKYPQKTLEDGQEILMGHIYNTLTKEEVFAYNISRKDFFDKLETKIRLEAQRDDLDCRMVRVSIIVNNSGTAPTGKMSIFLQVPEDIPLYEKGARKSVNYEQPKTPNYHPQLNNMSFGGIPYIPKVEMWDMDAYMNSNRLCDEVDPLTHNLKHKTFEFYVDSATCPNFKMQWIIVDAALVDPVRGELNVNFVESDND